MKKLLWLFALLLSSNVYAQHGGSEGSTGRDIHGYRAKEERQRRDEIEARETVEENAIWQRVGYENRDHFFRTYFLHQKQLASLEKRFELFESIMKDYLDVLTNEKARYASASSQLSEYLNKPKKDQSLYEDAEFLKELKARLSKFQEASNDLILRIEWMEKRKIVSGPLDQDKEVSVAEAAHYLFTESLSQAEWFNKTQNSEFKELIDRDAYITGHRLYEKYELFNTQQTGWEYAELAKKLRKASKYYTPKEDVADNDPDVEIMRARSKLDLDPFDKESRNKMHTQLVEAAKISAQVSKVYRASIERDFKSGKHTDTFHLKCALLIDKDRVEIGKLLIKQKASKLIETLKAEWNKCK